MPRRLSSTLRISQSLVLQGAVGIHTFGAYFFYKTPGTMTKAMSNPTEILLSDADGVVTDDRARPNMNVLQKMARLAEYMPMVIVTGRPAKWLEEEIIPHLEVVFEEHPPLLELAMAEYGTVRLLRDQRGWHKEKDPAPLENLRGQVADFISRMNNPAVVHDGTKEITISAAASFALNPAAEPHLDFESGLEEAGRFMKDLAGKTAGVDYHESTYARDLVPTGCDKAYGARLAIELFQTTFGSLPQKVHVLGDSLSDYGMVQPARQQGIPYTFYFVGSPDKVRDLNDPNVVVTKSRYDAGTAEVLDQFIH